MLIKIKIIKSKSIPNLLITATAKFANFTVN